MSSKLNKKHIRKTELSPLEHISSSARSDNGARSYSRSAIIGFCWRTRYIIVSSSIWAPAGQKQSQRGTRGTTLVLLQAPAGRAPAGQKPVRWGTRGTSHVSRGLTRGTKILWRIGKHWVRSDSEHPRARAGKELSSFWQWTPGGG